MLLRVCFGDNDFSTDISDACEDIMYTIANGCRCYEVIKKYRECKNEYGLENIRKAIVLASYGHFIVSNACRLYDKIEYDFSKQEYYMNYLDKKIRIEEVETYNPNDNNSESCYIDFWNLKVDIV